MIQLYVLTLLYLFFSASMTLYDSYRQLFSFMFSFRHRIYESRRTRYSMIAAGVLLSILNLLFPQHPGPIFLGNLVPALACLYVSYFYIRLGKGGSADAILYPSPVKGMVLFAVTILHFLFPFLVLL
ncbi:MAG: hypothetical protein IJ831_08655 [Spirochaetales bacterium]|nr:hypothetical protein [Spirochaetales bacterium]